MPALQPTANKTLMGHKLAVLLGVTAPPKMLLGATFLPEEFAELTDRFPDLSIIVVEGAIAEGESLPQKFANDQWQPMANMSLFWGALYPAVTRSLDPLTCRYSVDTL